MVDVIFEDADIVVVNKPAGMIVHAAPGHETGSLADALAARHPEMRKVGGAGRPGVVHRLDIGTSGVMVFARTVRAYSALRRQFESHEGVEKTYLAVLHGAPKGKKGTLETTIGRKPWDPKRQAVDVPDGLRAVTHWEVLQKRGGLSLVEFKIETGRMHQIRVHAAHLGAPVVGDELYGDAKRDRALRNRPTHPLLHAVQISFRHPATGKRVTYAAPPPPELVYAI